MVKVKMMTEGTPSEMEQGEGPKGEIQGRSVELIPASYDTSRSCGKMAGVVCCVALVIFISGGVMRGVCSDPNSDGCNEAIRNTGIGFLTLGALSCLPAAVCFVFAVCTAGGSDSTEKK